MTIHQSFLDPSSGDIPVDIGSAAADFSEIGNQKNIEIHKS